MTTVADATQPDPPAGTRKDSRASRTVVGIGAALVAVPFVIAALSAIGEHWNPVGDQALEVMRIRDVATEHTPLLGPWSRFGWAHPGPALFWFMTPWYRVFGNDGVLAGTAVLNLIAAVGVVIAGARVASAAGVLAGGITAIVAAALGLDFLLSPWNPWSAFFPFVLFLVLVWVVRAGHVGALAFAVVAGSFVVQTHASYLAPVGGLLLFAAIGVVLVACGRRALGDVATGSARRHLLIAVIVGIVMWLPPLIQQVTTDTGNLTKIVRYLERDQPTVGWDTAYGTMGNHLRPAGPWLTDDEQAGFGFERTASGWWALATLAAAAGLGAAAARRGARSAGQLALVALIGTGLALVATARVTGVLLPYVVGYWRPVAAIVYLSIAWSVVELVGTPRARGVATAIGFATLGTVAVLALVRAPADPPLTSLSRAIGEVGPPTASSLRRTDSYLVEGFDPATLDGGRTGLQLYLEQRGFRVFHGHEPLDTLMFGAHRVAGRHDVDGRIIMAAVAALRTGWVPPPGARVVAQWDPLSRRDRTRANQLESEVRAATGTAPTALLLLDAPEERARAVRAGARPAAVEALGRLQRKGTDYCVYLVDTPR